MRHAIDAARPAPVPPGFPDSSGAAGIALDAMTQNAQSAAQFLRCIANPHRLMILCHLALGEASVGQLERELGIRQAHLSQQLARLRQDGLVTTRRDSRTIYYALGSDAAREVIGLLYRLFCTQDGAGETAG
ncbi:metalloregulator ArsR/SmtB family transcription factor [Acidiphilium sp. AL]|uniref:Metalloregulator ArsR/SmtB family transcription factor n=1 Tax=Acidiphilium iwatense TaxID=768198 RepID=A0ABS9DWG5_9PROT|nr:MULTISPECIES: metalloregulator ArsR/SmtB family transcription factor [Acidiphilium]MCF3947091.1 metalloregulator ArsR/SmtB family transcription factor [Acidiphilium iwatense]MCU4160493.1 metalloregulator ArsR/SmtB family transcription factor [Acidiphilium sp. AL]